MKNLLIVLLLLSSALFGESLTLKSGMVGAHTEMVMDSTIDPLSTELKAQINITADDLLSLKGKLWIDMGGFMSDNTDRDEHMDETNEVLKFPKATYVISSITKAQKKNMYVIHGQLTYHGVSKAFMLDAEIFVKNNEIVINATSSFLLSDYGIEAPCMVFMCVRDQIDIFARAVLVK